MQMARRYPLICGMPNIGLNPMTSSLGDKLLTTSPILIFFEVLEVGRRELPIRQLVDQRIDMVRALVLVIKVVRMFPNVDRQQRLQASRDRRIGVGGFYDLELGTPPPPPGPAASKLGDRVIRQLFLAGVDASECGFHFVLERCRWFAASL